MQKNIDLLLSDAVGLLREMVRIPALSFCEEEVCAYISEWMRGKGIRHRRVVNNIVAENVVDGEKPTLMMCAHIDTVPASPGYEFDPYCPDAEVAARVINKAGGTSYSAEEIVAGLGSNDDGASVVSMIAAYRYFLESGRNIVLVLSCEEERSGKDGISSLWPELADKVDYAIIGEPTKMQAATSERGLLVIDATAEGVSGHAARNEGVNALYIALEDIQRLKEYEFSRVSDKMGSVKLNVTQINAGTAHNIIPDRCNFVIDIRPTEKYTNQEMLTELSAVCRSGLRARNLANRSSATAENSVLEAAAEKLGIATFSSPTTSDWMRVGCDAIKMGPGDSARSHRANEYVTTDEIRKGIETYIKYIETL